MRKPRLPSILADSWRYLVFLVIGAVFISGLLAYRLDTLTGGANRAEVAFVNSARSASLVFDEPLHLYQKAGNLVLTKLDRDNLLTARLLNSLLGLFVIVAYFIIVKSWYTERVAVIATMLFASSSWLLFTARLASPEASYLLPIGWILAAVLVHQGDYVKSAVLIAVLTSAALLYLPGAIWLLILTALWQRKFIRSSFSSLSALWQALAVVLIIVSLTPLVWSFINQPGLIRSWLGIPEFMPSPLEYLRNLANIPINLVIRGAGEPVRSVGKLPVLDLLTATMVLLGGYVAYYRLKLDRSRLIFGLLLFGCLLVSLGPVPLEILLVPLYLLAAGGVALLLQQWFTVFPRNPLARGVAILVVTGAIGLAGFYHVSKYFIAWPNVPATKSVFKQQL